MEVYFKNLTSDRVSVERLVEDLFMLVQDAEELVKATSGSLPGESRAELVGALERVKARSHSLKQQALAGVRATNRLIRRHPYSSAGTAFALGVLAGLWAGRR
jgi:ElaB/YqjD/DUF883 family membrane-anchored ribosome-binding protein